MSVENCFGCLTKHTIWLASFFGISRFYIECNHKSDGPQIKIIKSKVHMAVWFILVTAVCALSCWYIKLLLKFDKQDIAPWIFNFLNMINAVRALSVLIFSFYNSKYYENFCMIAVAALRDWNFKMYKPLLQQQDYYIDSFCSIAGLGSLIFAVFYVLIRMKSNMAIAKAIDTAAPVALLADVMLCLSMTNCLTSNTIIAQNSQNFVMEKLASRIAWTKIRNEINETEKSSFIQLLRDFRVIHEMRCNSFKHGNKYLNPILLIYGVLTTILPVICIVGIIYGPNSKDYTLGSIWQVPVMILGVSIGLVIMLALYNNLKTVKNEILPFLYKYPISKLHRDEALEIEITIMAINRQNIVIKYGDMFEPELDYLSACFGTVLTYVFVVVQFINDINKNEKNL